MSTNQHRYDASTIDELTLDCALPEPGPNSRHDPAYVGVSQTVWAPSRILSEMKAVQRHGGSLGGAIAQGYVDRLVDAFETGRRVLDHDDHDRLQNDLSTADAELLNALADDVAPVAPHFGIEIDLPTPDDVDAGEGVAR